MSTTDDIIKARELLDVVRLKVDGASTYVNTLRDQQTARGLSLVCPFPALEAEIPVSFGSGGGDEMRRGTIHRIGVEDDPETGLPRLRLSIRAQETRSTVVAPADQQLVDETSRMTEAPDACAETDIDLVVEPSVEVDEEPSEEPDEIEVDGDDTEPSLELPGPPPEPAWVGDELPLPAEFVDRMRSRKRRRVTGIAAWTTVLVVAIGGIYALTRADVVDLDSVRDYISGIVKDRGAAVGSEEQGSTEELPDSAVIAMDPSGQPVVLPDADPPGDEVSEPGELPIADEMSNPEPVAPSADEETSGTGPAIAAVSHEIAPVEEPSETDGSASNPDDITILLPTRWRAEYASSYRLRNPNGVVVDVPGGLVRREGWLVDAGKGHPMIRSVKAVQRENGARFVIFIHGELPRFLTVTKPGGIALRLYREPLEELGPAERVAILD